MQIIDLAVDDELERVRLRKPSVASESFPTRSKTPSEALLFVEPDVLVRAPIAEYLRECGYRVIEVNSLDAALTILNATDARIDLVLAEVSHLDASEGFAFAKRIRESHSGIDVILTSNVAHCANKAGDLCEAEAMLGKPYHSDELLRRINVLRERRRSSKLF